MNTIQPERCLILNRWDDEFAAYHRYIDHEFHRIAYIASPTSVAPLHTEFAVHIEVVPDLNHLPSVVDAARRCRHVLGGLDRIIALSEADLEVAAELRAQFKVQGPLPSYIARFRDKTLMKQAVLDAGIRAPAFARLADVSGVEAMIRDCGFPLMLKPNVGTSSIGCHIVQSRAEFERLRAVLPLADYECEEFVNGMVLHVDGVFIRDEFAYVKPSRYINSCYDFAHGRPMASIALAEGEFANELRTFAKKCLIALNLSKSAFHLELINAADGPCFLEIGARVPGGDIPFVIRDVFGVDLVREWLRVEFEDESAYAGPAIIHSDIHSCGGWLRLPEPVGKRLAARNSLVGKITGLYQEVLPLVGHVFDGSGGYISSLGGFRYRGPDEMTVESAIMETLRSYSYVLTGA